MVPDNLKNETTSFFAGLIKENRLRHAYMLCGESGIGKKTTASVIVNMIVCDTNDACGVCNGCKCHIEKTHPDIIYVDKGDKASVSVDKIRDAISKMYVKPILCDKRIIIVDEAHLMTKGAQNALLKALEEPPGYVVFFLMSDSTSAMLDTIMSRVCKIDIPPMPVSKMMEIVPNLEPFMYSYAKGVIGKLIDISNNEDFKLIRNNAIDIINCLLSGNEFDIYSFENIFSSREKLDLIYDFMAMFFRDVFLFKNNVDMIINSDKINEITAFSKVLSTKSCLRVIEILEQAALELGKVGNMAMSYNRTFVKCREVIND